MTDTDLLKRRARLIETLRTEALPKGTGTLCQREEYWGDETDWDDDHAEDEDGPTPENEYRLVGYCCIGVALKSEEKLDDDILAEDLEGDYELFMERYAVSRRVKDYLISMNDGDRRPRGANQATQHSFNQERSHPFIARFLEIVWALEKEN